MRALLQRVSHASVSVEDHTIGAIGDGLLILLGIGEYDSEAQVEKLVSKITKMRIFADEEGKTNLSIADIGGSALVVSQFTLYANCKKGNRPSFTQAGSPAEAERLYGLFTAALRNELGTERVATGSFGAHMEISLLNDGPFTIWLDTDTL